MSSQPSAPERPDAGRDQVVFEDGLGVRIRDESTGDLVERLVVCQELMRFEGALRDRMGRLANFRHVRYPRVRAVERTGTGDDQTLSVVTDAVKGYRLSSMLDEAVANGLVIDVNAALQVARELLPALSVLHDSRNVTHGALGPERIVLTTEARIVIVDHTLGLALERLRFPRSRLWREFRIAMPASAGLPQFDQRADVAQVAMVVLALMLGRPIGSKEFPDGLRPLVSDTPERLGGGAARPMTASLRGWFERALPLESRRPFATALEAQIALESVVTREVAYSPRPGALRSLLHRYEEVKGERSAASGSTEQETDTDAPPARRSARGAAHDSARSPSSPSSTRRRSGAKGRKAPTPEELEAEEIARLEAELARLIELEQQEQRDKEAEPAPYGKVVQFPAHHEVVAGAPDEEAAPAASVESPAQTLRAEDAPAAAPDVEPTSGPTADESNAPLDEEELAALSALLEAETQASVPTETGGAGTGSEETGAAERRGDHDPGQLVLEVDLDSAIDDLVAQIAEAVEVPERADDPEAAGRETPVWFADAVTAEPAEPQWPFEAEVPSADTSTPLEPGVADLVEAAVEPPLEPAADLAAEAWSLTPLTEAGAMALALHAVADEADEPWRDELTQPLDYEAELEPVTLAPATPYYLGLVRGQYGAGALTATDVARVLDLLPHLVEDDAAKALPLKRRRVPRRPAALDRAAEPVAALPSNASPVAASLVLYPSAGALVAPVSLAAAAVPAAVVEPAEELFAAVADATLGEAPTVAAADEMPIVVADAGLGEVLSAEPVEAPVAGVDVTAEPSDEPALASHPSAPLVDREAATEALADVAATPAATEPDAAADDDRAHEEGSTKARRRKRRRRKTKRAEPPAAPTPVEAPVEPRSQRPVVQPLAPWLRGREAVPAPPRETPSTVEPLSAPAAPSAAAPSWTRKGREPLPVLPSAERPQDEEAELPGPVAPIGDALTREIGDQPPRAVVPVAVPLAPTEAPAKVSATPPAEVVSSEASGEQPEEAGAHVVAFPVRRPTLSVNWRRTIAASIVIMLIEGGVFAAAYWYVKPREVGYLLVNSTVTGLDVSIDGQTRGKTPVSLELTPGRHTIELRGYGTTKTVPVEIAANVETTQMVAWPRPPEVGRLSLKTIPDGAQVIIDGQLRGVAPLTVGDLAPGTHRVVVENESGSVEQSVRIVANETLEVEVPIYSGWLALFAPVEVRIFEGGRLLGSSLDGRILMPPGRHRLELVNQRLGYRETHYVVIQPGRVAAVSVKAPRGTLVIDAPTGTSVSVDGVAMGVTPLGELSVEVGTREVIFQHPELGQRRITVTVGVGVPARASMLAPR